MGEPDFSDIATLLTVAGGILIGLIGLCCKFVYKIKISECNLCGGGLVIRRAISQEGAEEEGVSNRGLPTINTSRM
jgi:hypothetical protein